MFKTSIFLVVIGALVIGFWGIAVFAENPTGWVRITSPMGSETFKAGGTMQISFERDEPWPEQETPNVLSFALVESVPSNRMCIMIYPPPPGCEPKTNVIQHIANIPFASTSVLHSFLWNIPQNIPYSKSYQVRVGGVYQTPGACTQEQQLKQTGCGMALVPVYRLYAESGLFTIMPLVTVSSPNASPLAPPSAPEPPQEQGSAWGQRIGALVQSLRAWLIQWWHTLAR